MPKVSVIMPAYNSQKYIREAIMSILNQTYTDLELIVINDCSKDNTVEVIREIKDERLVFINNETNKGFLYGLNYGISIAKGEYIARLDDDDVSYPTRIAKQVEYLDKNKDVVLVGTYCDHLINGEKIKIEEKPIKTSEQLRFSLVFGNFMISHSSFMMRKNVMQENKIEYETFIQTPDFHMQTQMASVGKIACIPEVLVSYRIHSAQSTQVRSIQLKKGEEDRAKYWYIDRINLSEKDKQLLKMAVTRNLKTKEDIYEFEKAFENWVIECSLTKEEDRKCKKFIFNYVLEQQYCTMQLLKGCLRLKNKEYRKGISLRFWIKCILKYNKNYIPPMI